MPEGDPLCFLGISGIVVSTRLILFYFKIFFQASMWLSRHCSIVTGWTEPALGQAVGACASQCFFFAVSSGSFVHLRCHAMARCCSCYMDGARCSVKYDCEQDLVPAIGSSTGNFGEGALLSP